MPRRCVAVLALALAPRLAAAAEFRACETGEGFAVQAAWPEPDATDVPTDGIVVIVGTDLDGLSEPRLGVELEGVALEGALGHVGSGVYVWQGAPFMPNTTYRLVSVDLSDEGTAFTTGTAPAPLPPAPAAVDLELAQVEVEISECLQGLGACCVSSQVVDTELRMRATVTLPDPPAPFAAVNRAIVEVAPEPDFGAGVITSEQPWAEVVTVELGEAGTWPGDQVCARVSVLDPLDRRVDGEPTCAPIGDVNVVPDDPGCDCAATDTPGALLLVALVPLLRRRRRGAIG